ncbi:MAG: glutamate synthase subunit beta [Candidatus Aureabacteria bacterium]|nr:glutamate synthase subunit beta [Candidatus Auribacterota bacterium]
MGKPEGFMEIPRQTGHYRPVSERIRDYKEITQQLSDDEIRQQAARCMDCGVPFCHALGCPLGNLIPEWNDLVYKGNWKEALERLEATNLFPEITGRVCPAPCEASCTLSINSEPVTIRQIELAVIEYGFKQGWIVPKPPKMRTGKKAAVIGSGPAGLAAARELRRQGHDVTVYEKAGKPGGILRYGIPDFKLEKWVLDRRIDLMKKEGIHFETDVKIGEDLPASFLKKTYHCVILTIGAGKARNLQIEGRELKGIHFAMEYLTQSNCAVSGETNFVPVISAKEKNVVVIGGGDSGSDCVGTAVRQGAKKIMQFEILPKPINWEESTNPSWPDWPLILRTSSSHEEGGERDWGISTKKFQGKNQVEEILCCRVNWKNEAGKAPWFEEIPDSLFTVKADLVFLAMGFVHVEHDKLLDALGVAYDARGNIRTDGQYKTSNPGVFAAGDANTGASLVVRAIYHGRKAAVSADEFLKMIS